MSFKRINNITGWLVCIIACSVYIMTMEATGSLWDCGEFASSAYKLQIPHPPGAPLFALIGRLFMAPFDPQHAATGINLMSALASGFTILFLFWSITHFARKIVTKNGVELTNANIVAVMAAGIVGALAYTFSDSFWYSAVEGEVYALSSFFTALVFWAMLKWEQNVDVEEAKGIKGHFTHADRWIILIFFLMGLSIGVHLLNILTIPTIVVIYYYKRYKLTNWGLFWAFVIGCVLTGVVQKAVIQWTIKGAGNFDVLFVNSFGLPYFSGFAFFFVFIAALIFFGLRIAKSKNWNFLKLGLWSFAFMVMGCFSSYFTTLVRSNANPSVDMYNVDNPVSLVGYLSREQYGDWPILYGQDFTASPIDSKVTETYVKSNGRYEKNGRKVEYVYAPEDMHLFPRMWDQSNDQGHADYYASWAGIGKDKQGNWERKPTVGENIQFAFSYQLGWMYLRYFMWNFAGKQNDLQGVYMGNVRDGNWITGIAPIDNLRLGNQDMMPDSLKNNKANNKLFALPLILGLLGLIYQIKKDNKDAFVVGLLFLLTGAAVIFYLNQAGNQPRERDYAFVGSFYAFAIWIGLGVLYVKELFGAFIKNTAVASYAAAALCTLAVPVIMASQEWDDHDRSHKTMARDLATDYLESCAPNAIVISYGDNDTYPLWYAQEVEGIRTDIRVINSSLLGTDWYINQLRYKLNNSDPIDPIWTAEQIEGSNRDIIYNAPKPGIDPNKYMDLYTMMKDYAGSDDPSKTEQGRDGSVLNIYPSKKVSVPVDINLVKQNGTVNATDSVVSELTFEIPKTVIYKNDAAVLNIIASNKWKRPIYFTSPNASDIGIDSYIRQDGLTYRLVPVINSPVNNDWVYDKLMNKFKFGSADVKGVYFDEENRRHLNSIRLAYAQAASSLADAGKKEEAKKMLNRCDKMMLEENFPYGLVSRGQQHNQFSLQMLIAAYKAGDTALAKKISTAVKKDLEQQMTYLTNLPDSKQDAMQYEMQGVQRLLMGMEQLKNQFEPQVMLPAETAPTIKTNPVTPGKAADSAPKQP
ncbi:MAG: glycosyltransferase family 117 protein [Ferruginibacter sp.]